jgi:hypothetical protein
VLFHIRCSVTLHITHERGHLRSDAQPQLTHEGDRQPPAQWLRTTMGAVGIAAALGGVNNP